MVPGNVQVPLPGGAPLWVVTVGPTGVRVEGASVPPGPPPIPDNGDDDDDNFFERLLDKIMDFLRGITPFNGETGMPVIKDEILDRIIDLLFKYLEESGIIERIIERILEKLLGKLGA
jgi:hypothetical protein